MKNNKVEMQIVDNRRVFYINSDLSPDQVKEYFECIFPAHGGKGSLVERLPTEQEARIGCEIMELESIANRLLELSGPHHGGANQCRKLIGEMVEFRKQKMVECNATN